MGKGYFSLEEAPVNGSSVYTIVKLISSKQISFRFSET